MDDLHRNYIDGDWVDGEAIADINPSNTDEIVGRLCAGSGRRRRARHRRRQGGVSGMVAFRHPAAPRRPQGGRRRDPGAARGTRRPARARGGQDAGRRHRRDGAGRRRSSISSPARRCGCPARVVPSVRPGIEVEHDPRADRRRRASSRRGTSRSPSPPGRSRRRSATATRWSSSRPIWCRAAPGRSSTSCTAPACPRACSTWSWARARWSARRSSIRPTSTPSPSPARSIPAARWPTPRSSCMRKFQLEMGGKNPLVVLDDADLDVAVECGDQRLLLLDRAALHRLVAAGRDRGHPRQVRRRADRAAEEPQGRQCLQGGHAYRPGGRSEPAQAGRGLYPHRPRGRRQAALGRRAAQPRDPRLLPAAGAVRRDDAQDDASTARRSSGRWRASSG